MEAIIISNYPSVTEVLNLVDSLSATNQNHKFIRDNHSILNRCISVLEDELTDLELMNTYDRVPFDNQYYKIREAIHYLNAALTEAFLAQAENNAMHCGEYVEFDDEGNSVYPIHPTYLTSDDELPF